MHGGEIAAAQGEVGVNAVPQDGMGEGVQAEAGVGEAEFGGAGATARVRLWCRGADPGACLVGMPPGAAGSGHGF